MSNGNRKSLLYHWSIRYFLLLFICMAVVGVSSFMIIQRNAVSNQYRGMELMARDIAAAAADNGGVLPGGADLGRFLDDLAREYGLNDRSILFLLDRNGRTVQQHPPFPPHEAEQLASRLPDIMSGRAQTFELEPILDREPFIVAVHPIGTPPAIAGYVLYLSSKINMLRGIPEFMLPRLIVLFSLFLGGWAIIYMMTRRLVKPIQEAADVAKQIVSGNYSVRLNYEHDEKEIYELMHSFKEMADRLNRLESLRTQLLASVTHELKTPVTSISGLVQAVKDGVVGGAEAKTFLDVCLKESGRLQKMIEDLIDFNSFAANTVAVRHELFELGTTMTEIVERWWHSLMRPELSIVVEVEQHAGSWNVLSDPTRIEQIMINLLNNAKDAIDGAGAIAVRLTAGPAEFRIQVQDTGRGIPAEEQEDIFEPFYRGKEKKTRVRGMGIGLPFSRLIARSLGGDLVLAESSPEGTTFHLLIPARPSR